MRYAVLNFLTLVLNIVHFIIFNFNKFESFRYFVKFYQNLSLNTYKKKNRAYGSIMCINCYCNNLYGTLYTIINLFDPTNTILLKFIE